MIRFWGREALENATKQGLKLNILNEHVIFNEKIWKTGRKCFTGRQSSVDEIVLLPVLDREHELVCFAWQDKEANRELRMLRELEKCNGALGFEDLNPNCLSVTIHGCNELAYYFALYLQKRGICVNVEGSFWDRLGSWEYHRAIECRNYEIWAEGVHQKNNNLYEEQLRSISAEFECVNEIYEANIKAGKIRNADERGIIYKLRNEKEIIIRGIGTKAQEAYDWLLSNGMDIQAFLSEKARSEGRTELFGKPIVRQTELKEHFPEAVLIECSEKNSAWGFGAVDRNDYEGYERNERYFLLRDYVEVPENGIMNVVRAQQKKNIVLIGDIRLCSRLCRSWVREGIERGRIRYWDILEENKSELEQMQMPMILGGRLTKENIYMLMVPEYDSRYHITDEAAGRYRRYTEKLHAYGIYDYTDYYSNMLQCILFAKGVHLDDEKLKYTEKELCPSAILLGAAPPHSGNTLIRHSLAGHPQIVMIQEVGYFNNNLYSICIRLAEVDTENILEAFWKLYGQEAGEDTISEYFSDKRRFDWKMENLLRFRDRVTSQELFVIFHLAYEFMHGREISDLTNIVIYWEPHQWDRELVGEWSHWLGDEKVKGFLIRTVRNAYMRTGSGIRTEFDAGKRWESLVGSMGTDDWRQEKRKIYENWKERVIRFEDLKRYPRKELTELCEWLGIIYDDILLRTTRHGQTAYYRNLEGESTGFGLEPIYKQYEEYFSAFDRMRLCLLDGAFQKKWGYPYISCLEFSRRELEEMFRKEFRWEKLPQMENDGNKAGIWHRQERFRLLLWQARFMEITNFNL